jgi:hypothetical protein
MFCLLIYIFALTSFFSSISTSPSHLSASKFIALPSSDFYFIILGAALICLKSSDSCITDRCFVNYSTAIFLGIS